MVIGAIANRLRNIGLMVCGFRCRHTAGENVRLQGRSGKIRENRNIRELSLWSGEFYIFLTKSANCISFEYLCNCN